MTPSVPKLKAQHETRQTPHSGHWNGPGKKNDPVPDAGESGFGGTPRFKPVGGGTVESFEAKGRKIFSNDNYKMLRPEKLYILRLQYALVSEGLNIGKHGAGEWGGDAILGKDTRNAIRHVMKREGLDHDQAVAWLMDRAKSKVGLGGEKPYFNPRTKAFDLAAPLWAKRSKNRNEFVWSQPSITMYEDERKFAPRRDELAKIWNEQLEPKLRKNGRSEAFIKRTREQFEKTGAKYVREGSMEGAKVVGDYRRRLATREERFAWVKDQWDREIAPGLAGKKLHPTVVAQIKKDFFGEFAFQYFSARNEADETAGKDSFKREKKIILDWNPHGTKNVA